MKTMRNAIMVASLSLALATPLFANETTSYFGDGSWQFATPEQQQFLLNQENFRKLYKKNGIYDRAGVAPASGFNGFGGVGVGGTGLGGSVTNINNLTVHDASTTVGDVGDNASVTSTASNESTQTSEGTTQDGSVSNEGNTVNSNPEYIEDGDGGDDVVEASQSNSF